MFVHSRSKLKMHCANLPCVVSEEAGMLLADYDAYRQHSSERIW